MKRRDFLKNIGFGAAAFALSVRFTAVVEEHRIPAHF